MISPPLLEVSRLSHRFANGHNGLDQISFQIESGCFAVLAGSNGSGKTLLMRHLNGLLKPTSGQVCLEGTGIEDHLPEVRRKVGLIFQEADAQIVGQTVARDVAFGPENLRWPREKITESVQQALGQVHLESFAERRPHTLSGGEKRRLAIAGVLAMSPSLLVLDEPFTGLDWQGCSDLIAILRHLNRDNHTAILLITHDLDKILAHAHRLILMHQGRIIQDGRPEQVLEVAPSIGVRRPAGPIEHMTWLTDHHA